MGYNRFSAREFNHMVIDDEHGTITKSSQKKQKLLDEVNWYKSLPGELVCFAPRVLDVKESEDSVSFVMELFPYPNLACSWLKNDIGFDKWQKIIGDLFKIHKTMEKYETETDVEELKSIYKTKTIQRLEDIQNKNPEIAKMMQDDNIVINNISYKNFPLLKDVLIEKIENLLHYNRRTICHGDYCFSNILSDGEGIYRFVDPRGGFFRQSIYGDPRYDIAKLRHSFVGLYDFIIADLFEIKEKGGNSFEFKIDSEIDTENYEKFFDSMVVEYGFDCDEIKFIEALLFLTMIPLHSDKPNHQKAFYLIAIKKLNEVIYGK